MSPKIKMLNILPIMCGMSAIFLGVTVLVGWYTYNQLLIQVHPQFAPMQYNTALGFLLSGIGLIALMRNKQWVSLPIGVSVLALGLLTLLEYILDVDFKIDQLFMEHYILVHTSHPGRMAPNTALCFLISGSTLIFSTFLQKEKSNGVCAEILALTILGLAFMAFWGYIQQAERAYGWADFTRMAIHTTFGFIILGFGFISNVWYQEKGTLKGNEHGRIAIVPLWIPFSLFIAALTFDLYTSTGIVSGIAYIPLVFCSLWFVQSNTAFILATISTVLIVTGYFASPDFNNALHSTAIINRLMSVAAIWITAFIIFIQKSTDFKLKHSEIKVKTILDNAGDGIFGLNLQGHITFANNTAEEMLGYKIEEMVGVSQHDLVHHTHADGTKYDRENCNIYAAFADGKTRTIDDEVFWHKDGYPVQVEYTSTPIRGEHGEVTGAVVVFRDITERKKMQDDLITANTELEEFSYRTSHDLRSPLMSSIGLLDLTRQSIEKGEKEKSIQTLDMAQGSLKKLENLVKDILQLTKAKNSEEKVVGVDVSELIKHSLEKLAHMDNFDRLDIDLDVQPECQIQTKKSRLKLIVENLISNAVKYQDLEKDKSFIRIISKIELGNFIFSVEDNGLGIPKDQQEKLFTMFKRFHPKTSFGSGLGLYMIKKSADILGGEISYSDTGEGTLFKLMVPLKQKKQ